MKWVCDHRSESQFKQLRKSPKKKDFGASTVAIHCDGHTLISFVFPQFTSFHSIIKIVDRLTNMRLEFKNLHKFVTLLIYFVTTSATLNLHWWKIWQVYPCVNMQILFMHSLQELHRETLQTFRATFICSVLDYEGRKRKQGIMFCLRPGTSEWSVFKKLCILLYGCLVMFTFAECSPSPRRKVFSFHNTDPRDIIS